MQLELADPAVSQPGKYRVLASQIGNHTTIEGWPASNLDGLFQALKQWALCPRFDMSGDDPDHPHVRFEKPYRGLCWGHCVEVPMPGTNGTRRRTIGTKPIYPEHPEAIRYFGNFLGYSFGFSLDTVDPLLIAELGRLIAENMARPDFIAAKALYLSRYKHHRFA